MKVIPFTIPVTTEQSVILEEYNLPWFYNQLHRHKEIQITLVIKSKGTLIAGNYMQKFKEGDIYILGANQPHIFKSDLAYFEKKFNKNIQALTIFFDPTESFGSILNLPEMKEVKRFLLKTKSGLQVPLNDKSDIAEDILKLKECSKSILLANFINLLTKLTSIKKWKVLSTEVNSISISENQGLRMNDIYQYTMLHSAENISLHQIASIAHLTVPAFCKYFKKHTRKTYITFLNEIRVNEACNKIMEGKYEGISSIAYETGFNNVTSFNRVFKIITGTSPIQFRNNLEK